jgi:hypothetical protein
VAADLGDEGERVRRQHDDAVVVVVRDVHARRGGIERDALRVQEPERRVAERRRPGRIERRRVEREPRDPILALIGDVDHRRRAARRLAHGQAARADARGDRVGVRREVEHRAVAPRRDERAARGEDLDPIVLGVQDVDAPVLVGRHPADRAEAPRLTARRAAPERRARGAVGPEGLHHAAVLVGDEHRPAAGRERHGLRKAEHTAGNGRLAHHGRRERGRRGARGPRADEPGEHDHDHDVPTPSRHVSIKPDVWTVRRAGRLTAHGRRGSAAVGRARVAVARRAARRSGPDPCGLARLASAMRSARWLRLRAPPKPWRPSARAEGDRSRLVKARGWTDDSLSHAVPDGLRSASPRVGTLHGFGVRSAPATMRVPSGPSGRHRPRLVLNTGRLRRRVSRVRSCGRSLRSGDVRPKPRRKRRSDRGSRPAARGLTPGSRTSRCGLDSAVFVQETATPRAA